MLKKHKERINFVSVTERQKLDKLKKKGFQVNLLCEEDIPYVLGVSIEVLLLLYGRMKKDSVRYLV